MSVVSQYSEIELRNFPSNNILNFTASLPISCYPSPFHFPFLFLAVVLVSLFFSKVIFFVVQ